MSCRCGHHTSYKVIDFMFSEQDWNQPPQSPVLRCLDSLLCVSKQSPYFTFVKQDWYYKGLVQIVLPSKPDVIAAPDPVQPRHCCYCSSDVDICSGAAIFGEIGSQVLKTVDLFWPYPVYIYIMYMGQNKLYRLVTKLNLYIYLHFLV